MIKQCLIFFISNIKFGYNVLGPGLTLIKSWLSKCFSMKDLGEAAYILGIRIHRDRSQRLLGLSQTGYIDKVLKRFSMEDSKKGFLPMSRGIHLKKS